MKKFILPKLPHLPHTNIIYRHFKKKPSRLVTWTSIFAITVALVITVFNPNSLNNRAKASPEIMIYGTGNNPTKVSLVGGPNYWATMNDPVIAGFSNTVKQIDSNLNQAIFMNYYLIDADGYLKVRYSPDYLFHQYSFEYIYYHDSTDNRVKLTPNTDLVIDGPVTTVYMEGAKEEAIKFKSLTIDNGATLTQVPAGRDGLNIPYSTRMRGLKFFGYYQLEPGQKAEFDVIASGSGANVDLHIGNGKFVEDKNIDSDIGNYYDYRPTGQSCSDFAPHGQDNTNIYTWINAGSPCSPSWLENNSSTTKFFPFAIDISGPFNSLNLQHYVRNLNDSDITNGFEDIPAKLIYGLNADSTRSANFYTVGMAYYFPYYGVRQNDSGQIFTGTPSGWNIARSFQTLEAELYNKNGNDDTLYEYGLTRDQSTFNGTNPSTTSLAFKFNWNSSSGYTVTDPISQIVNTFGEDYLLAPVAEYVKNSKSPSGTAGIMTTEKGYKRQAIINIDVSETVNIINGKIDVTGKGYAGGLYGGALYRKPNPQYNNNILSPDSVIASSLDGAGPGGGSGAWTERNLEVYSGSYGGSGTIMGAAATEMNPSLSAKFNGLTYGGGALVNQPTQLGSGGGFFNNQSSGPDWASMGGAGGGAIHIKAKDLIVNLNGIIKANGGHGWVGLDDCFSSGTYEALSVGILGKTGYQLIQNKNCATNFSPQESGTSGSGGSVWLEVSNTYTNNGIIAARGVEGAFRVHVTLDDQISSTRLYNSYFNSDAFKKCLYNDPSNPQPNMDYGCQGAASGGGRMAIYFGNSTNDNGNTTDPARYLGNASVWGGGTTDGSDNNYDLPVDDRSINYPVGSAGSLVTGPSATGGLVNVQTISIDKSVNLCLLDNCADGDGDGSPDIDTGNATASTGAWMLVQIKLFNNTGKDQNNITITDEKFKTLADPTTIKAVTDSANWVDNTSDVGWDNISIAKNTEKILKYYFQVKH